MDSIRRCSVEGCDKAYRARGLCSSHYGRWLKANGASVLGLSCTVEGCGKAHAARGYCFTHYSRWKTHGTPEPHWEEFTPLPGEEWRPVPGWEGLYEVSDAGRLRSLDRVVDHARLGQARYRPRLLAAVDGGAGYLYAALSHRGRKHREAIHRLVLKAFVSEPPPGTEGCHNNGDRADNRLENLRWDTTVANAGDRKRHGTDWQSAKTHCPQGHPYSGSNLIIERTGGRKCRECKRARDRKPDQIAKDRT